MQTIHILGGGTFSPVRNHLALAAPAFGATARKLATLCAAIPDVEVKLHLTKMADATSTLITNDDVRGLVDQLIADATTKVIIFNVALCDFSGEIDGVPSGQHATRLKTKEGTQTMVMTPTDKLIGRIRQQRKDIFVVGFKTTTRANVAEQYQAGLKLLKTNSLNLVLANDTVTRNNMIVTPEEASYHMSSDREYVLSRLVDMIDARMRLTFTRSTVVDAPPVPWSEQQVPANLFSVVNHLITRGAYQPFMGKTVGHFAYRSADDTIVTSRRKSNFNNLATTGMIRIVPQGTDRVLAYGGKPSVGGQSQRIIFKEHADLDCIAHAHIPLKPAYQDTFPTALQWPYECGSHECGRNTSTGLREVEPGIWAVYLENHGPNVVFGQSVPATRVIAFFEKYFDVSAKVGGSFSPEYAAA